MRTKLVMLFAVVLLALTMACGPSIVVEPLLRTTADIPATVVVVSTAAAR